jgi:hypothetical protein
MNVEDSLKALSLDELLELFSEATKQLLKSKINNESADIIDDKQRLVERIQNAIVVKRAENPPLK